MHFLPLKSLRSTNSLNQYLSYQHFTTSYFALHMTCRNSTRFSFAISQHDDRNQNIARTSLLELKVNQVEQPRYIRTTLFTAQTISCYEYKIQLCQRTSIRNLIKIHNRVSTRLSCDHVPAQTKTICRFWSIEAGHRFIIRAFYWKSEVQVILSDFKEEIQTMIFLPKPR